MTAEMRSESGIALVLSLFLMLAMSVIAGSLMFLSQTETYASMNYRLMTQARYAAESGIHRASNYLMSTAYAVPDTAVINASYDIAKSPVLLKNTTNQVLLTSPRSASFYADGQTRTDFANNVATGSLDAGGTPMTYNTTATLVSMRQIAVYGSTTPKTVQTWQIRSTGEFAAGLRKAQVEVSATLERQVGPAFQYAAFAVYNGCDAIDFTGLASTNSYDSANALVGGLPVTGSYGGNVGTNGNLTANGTQATINGSLSTPRTGNGTCSAANVTAETLNGGSVTAGVLTLPQPVVMPTPDLPSPLPPTTTMNLSVNCNAYGGPECNPNGTGGHVTFTPVGTTPVLLGDVNLTGTSELHLKAGTYNVNSITATANSKIVVDSGPVILNVAGTGFSGNQKVINFAGQMASNSTYDPTQLQIVYAGTATIEGAGGSDNAALVYAPNANVVLTGASDWYGALVGKYISVNGGAALHYDRHLQKSELALGGWALSSFTWKKY